MVTIMEKPIAVIVAIIVMVMSSGFQQVRSDAWDHRFEAGDFVPLYANKPMLQIRQKLLGEVLNGDRLVSRPYALDFLVDKESEVVCRKKST